jgi:alcohol dehydrogenase (cytochrome c)/quinohemoprotein ethanol dehydrogenase
MALLVAACSREQPANTAPAPAPATPKAAAVDAARLVDADQDSADWLSYGRTYDEQRFSPLKRIDAQNVSQLGLKWHYDLPVDARAQESTPLVIDGTMYITGAWSKVFALNAATGAVLWTYDPKVPGETGLNACCDAVNRGVAAWGGKIYVGTLDGRLVALDATSGKPVWEVRTVPQESRYTITGAPRVVKGKVLIGNAGGEMVVRGYLSAYDAETGLLAWRFYTVPNDSGKPDGAASDEVLESQARPTWKGEGLKLGAGGTVWDAMAYDPKLDLLYIGTDNGGPWNTAIRSPGGGDNLFISSIIALRPDTGTYVWHYQTTPGEAWDFSSAQQLILADLDIDGRTRQVIMQAPKNGFFYLLDRTNGQLISAHQYADNVNWARGIDPKSGRPVVNPEARYGELGKAFISAPGPAGAHNWQPMAFSPLTKLVYLPVSEISFPFVPVRKFEEKRLAWNVGVDFDAGSLPQDPLIKAAAKAGLKGHLVAWDPVAQKEAWRVEAGHPWNGGVLVTAGDLVFEGSAMGEFSAFAADSGKQLWSMQTQTGIGAAPVTYEVGDEQYVVVEVGWGGAFGLAAGELARDSQINRGNVPRVLAFALRGSDTLPPPPAQHQAALEQRPELAGATVVAAGKATFHRYCSACHGDAAVSGGVLPDLRYSAAVADPKLWQNIVHDGVLQPRGMVAFGAELDPQQIDTVRAYIVHRINESIAEQRKAQHAQK